MKEKDIGFIQKVGICIGQGHVPYCFFEWNIPTVFNVLFNVVVPGNWILARRHVVVYWDTFNARPAAVLKYT
jgi:hypothetical protein